MTRFELATPSPPAKTYADASNAVGQISPFSNPRVSAGSENDCPTFGSRYQALNNLQNSLNTNQKNSKSYAQVASSVAPSVAHACATDVLPRSTAGRSPIPLEHKKSCTHGLRLRAGELEILRNKSENLGMSLNAYIRAKALGDDYIERPPDWLRDVLLQLYVELSRQGNNLNQIARSVNSGHITADAGMISADCQRAPIFRLMEKIELALSGRRPPGDY